MNQPAKRKTDADATETNQFSVTGIFCGKLPRCPVRDNKDHVPIEERRINTGLLRYPPSSRTAAWPRCTARSVIAANQRTGNIGADFRFESSAARFLNPPARAAGFDQNALENEKTRPGGQPDGSSHMGRLGWMGARAEYSRWGGITAPTLISRSRRAGRSKHQAIFLIFLFRGSDGFPPIYRGKSEPDHRVVGRLGSFAADLSDAIEGAESFNALLTEALLRSGAFSAAG